MGIDYKTGTIWTLPTRKRAQVVRRVCERLEHTYGRPRHGNPEDPLDDLVYIILSNRTSPSVAIRTYNYVKERFPEWNEVISSHPSVLQSILKPAGLSAKKSNQLIAALMKIKEYRGSCELNFLSKLSEEKAHDYLLSLPGVSEKVAKCVLMYTLGIDVLPVDSHVHRISNRLGWTSRKRADQCHDELEALIPPHRRFSYHVDCISHGRMICRPKKPQCGQCIIKPHCLFHRGEGKNV